MSHIRTSHWLRSAALLAAWALGLTLANGATLAGTLTYGDEPRNTELQRFSRWVDALNKHVGDMVTAPDRCADGEQAYCFLLNYDSYLQSIRGAGTVQQIAAVNQFVNQIDYVEDEQNYGVGDYWASPLEFFRNSGDCEDFAIAKYVAFRRLGYSDDQVRVWVVHDVQRRVDHAVLTVAIDGRTFVLDSLTDQILDAESVNRYAPIYSINASAWWLHDMDLARRSVATSAR